MAYASIARAAPVFVLLLIISIWLFSSFKMFPAADGIESLTSSIPRMHSSMELNSTAGMRASNFPLLIHTMWKSPNSPPPSETLRWKKGCMAVNPDHVFKMYYDADLLEFVKKNYPEYLTLFQSLKGVYMADMARVLVIYHFGGIYMDLDFYCYRPFTCIVDRLLPQTKESMEEKDVLVVSLEPTIHANIFRDKERVVIQDFYMSTVRHPFFKWLLDDRLQKFNANPQHPAKGPFSYSIEVDIDAYREYLRRKESSSQVQLIRGKKTNVSDETLPSVGSEAASSQSVRASRGLVTKASDAYNFPDSSGATTLNEGLRTEEATGARGREHRKYQARSLEQNSGGGYIHELREDVLHSLVDSTNPRLKSVCARGKDIAPWAIKSCEKVRAGKYFSPSEFTIAVHMWTHTFLGWSFFRGLYNSGVYAEVERSLVPSHRCPKMFS